ncbi:MAG TPA: tRNA uridine-5-carboxymethylaminomethyl(34) synthesis GTPase MnmE [Alcanivoracaceae bacterium]|nr:tRNA uridine-5-carboxymethylaminomethyl(34) synthesis GTPase MnmE [Alcanivoracaceae bacterium]
MAYDKNDTIVAVATATGPGGVGIVRLSGKEALTIGLKICRRENSFTPRFAHYHRFYNTADELLDEGLVLYFPGPHSFTGEDVVELQGHGGPVLLDQLVQSCISLGARYAEPGEFSYRAFMNDRLDLAQAEAIADLIDAGTASAAKAAANSLTGAFSKEVNALVEGLIQLRMYVEAAIDFPDEEIDFLSDGHIEEKLLSLIENTENVLAVAQQGRLLREGITVVIAGRPNAGKSSLLNQLAGSDVAIVTDIPGTTRDVLRETIHIDGMPIKIIDTAGLRESPDVVEQEGIKRAWLEIEQADHILHVMDSSKNSLAALEQPESLLPSGQKSLYELGIPVTHLWNKADLSGLTPGLQAENSQAIAISAATGAGIEALKVHLKAAVGFTAEEGGSAFSARRRHVVALESGLAALRDGAQQLQLHQAGELLAEDLRAAQQALEDITGVFTADDLLGRIFGSFCIGK